MAHIHSAQIIALLLQVRHLIAGHHFHPWLWVSCTSHGLVPQLRAGGCTVVSVTQHSAKISW